MAIGFALARFLTLGLAIVLAPPAVAVQLSGFASLGLGRVNDESTFIGNYGQSWSMRTDTVLGVQLNTPLGAKTSLTAQALVEGFSYDDKDDYEPDIEWLFLTYQPNASSRVRFGRLRTPMFLYSKELPVGYAYSWARPPIEVYNPLYAAVAETEGIDIVFFRRWRDKDVELGFIAGRMQGSVDLVFVDAEPLIGINVTVQDFESRYRYSMLFINASQYSEPSLPLEAGFRQAASAIPSALGADDTLSELATMLRVDDEWLSYHSIGAEWYRDDWTWTTEFNFVDSASVGFSPEIYGLYLSSAKQLGDYQPYVVGAYTKFDSGDYVSDVIDRSTQVIPIGLSPDIDFLRQVAGAIPENTNFSGYSLIVGCRWDWHRNAALKFEFQYFDRPLGSLGGFRFRETDAANTLLSTIIMDIIF